MPSHALYGYFAVDAYSNNGLKGPSERHFGDDPLNGWDDVANASESVITINGQTADFNRVDSDFYAVAYRNESDIVISYRGTNFDESQEVADLVFWSDANDQLPPQVLDAYNFYQAVKAAAPGANITFTGHSLGGALAGMMGRRRV